MSKNDTYSIIEDPIYGFKRLNPIPSHEEVERFYKEEFYSSYKQFNNSSLDVQEKDKIFFDSRWERIYEVAEGLKGSSGKTKIINYSSIS